MKSKQQHIKFFLICSIAIFLVASPLSALAQDQQEPVTCDKKEGTLPDPDTGKCPLTNPAEGFLLNIPDFKTLLSGVVNILLSLAGAIAVIFLVIGGYQYVVARGNEEAVEQAKKTITGSIIGIAIIVLAFAIIQIVNNILTSQFAG